MRHISDLKRRELALQRAADIILHNIGRFEIEVYNQSSFATDDASTAWALMHTWRELLQNAKRGLQ